MECDETAGLFGSTRVENTYSITSVDAVHCSSRLSIRGLGSIFLAGFRAIYWLRSALCTLYAFCFVR